MSTTLAVTRALAVGDWIAHHWRADEWGVVTRIDPPRWPGDGGLVWFRPHDPDPEADGRVARAERPCHSSARDYRVLPPPPLRVIDEVWFDGTSGWPGYVPRLRIRFRGDDAVYAMRAGESMAGGCHLSGRYWVDFAHPYSITDAHLSKWADANPTRYHVTA